ncbi:unnamed protein product, partial [Effrenium voratum]
MSVENMQPKVPIRHPLFAEPSYLTLWQVCPDLMHSKHLGVDQYVAGSVLALLTCGGLPAQFQAACDSVLEDIKAACSRHGARSLASLKPSMCLSDVKQPWAHYPRLKAKAAETKHLMPALRDDTKINSNIARLDMSCRIDSIIDACPRFALPTDASAELLEEGRFLFNVTFKPHWLLHSLLMAKHASPRPNLSRLRLA